MTTPPTRTARASPTRRGLSTPPAISAPPPARPSPSTRHAGGGAGDHRDCYRHRRQQRLHHQRHHADRCRGPTARWLRARRFRSAAMAAPPGTMSRRPGTSWSYDRHRQPARLELHLTRRGLSTPPAISAPPPARPSPSTRDHRREALAITAIVTDTGSQQTSPPATPR